MAALALTCATCAVAGFARAALNGCFPALAFGFVDAVAAGGFWLAGLR